VLPARLAGAGDEGEGARSQLSHGLQAPGSEPGYRLGPAKGPWLIGYLERDCSPVEMLGYHQPRDSQVHS
jgi:hypothetical protein